MKRRYPILLGVVIVLAAAYAVLLREASLPSACAFQLDIARLRTLASAVPGDKATEVRVDRFAQFSFPEALVYTGGSVSMTAMTVYAYQLVFPDGTVLIDTAMAAADAEKMHGEQYDAAAWARMQKALREARGIYVTHEHADHLGGLYAEIEKLPNLDAVRLTDEQLAHPENTKPLSLAPAVASKLKPVMNDGLLAVAPGVVLIKASGHTPGSQLVYVQLANGTELLLLGDTAWHVENVAKKRQPPRVASLLLHNDREANACQLMALFDLSSTAPTVEQVPGHDARVIDRLVQKGVMVREFR